MFRNVYLSNKIINYIKSEVVIVIVSRKSVFFVRVEGMWWMEGVCVGFWSVGSVFVFDFGGCDVGCFLLIIYLVLLFCVFFCRYGNF